MTWDPVHDSRRAFLSCLRAQCAPGRPQPLPATDTSADPDLDAAAAILLALLDPGLTLAVTSAGDAARVAAEVRRATGAGDATVETADFVLAAGPGASVAARARRGTTTAPERGATVVYVGAGDQRAIHIDGPGIATPETVTIALGASELDALVAANAVAPLGVDAFVVRDTAVVALPRSTVVTAVR